MYDWTHCVLDKRKYDTEDHCYYTVYGPGLHLHYTNVLIACWYFCY